MYRKRVKSEPVGAREACLVGLLERFVGLGTQLVGRQTAYCRCCEEHHVRSLIEAAILAATSLPF